MSFEHDGGRQRVRLPLVGDFQASNALVAAGLVIATGANPRRSRRRSQRCGARKGRLELAGTQPNGAPIFVDYAHTPDALAKALDALRPYVARRLVVVFGCGGDRDKGKRPQMGAVAVAQVPTSPSSPTTIRAARSRPRSARAILAAAPGAIEIGDRAQGHRARASPGWRAGDVLLIAGKGHETGQIVGGTIIPFSIMMRSRPR